MAEVDQEADPTTQRLVCGRQGCAATATHYLEFHPCLEKSALTPSLVCEPCLRDLRRIFEHGRAMRCPDCETDLTTFDQFVPTAEVIAGRPGARPRRRYRPPMPNREVDPQAIEGLRHRFEALDILDQVRYISAESDALRQLSCGRLQDARRALRAVPADRLRDLAAAAVELSVLAEELAVTAGEDWEKPLDHW